MDLIFIHSLFYSEFFSLKPGQHNTLTCYQFKICKLKAMDQLDHLTKLYIYSFMQDNFFNEQSIFLKIWET